MDIEGVSLKRMTPEKDMMKDIITAIQEPQRTKTNDSAKLLEEQTKNRRLEG